MTQMLISDAAAAFAWRGGAVRWSKHTVWHASDWLVNCRKAEVQDYKRRVGSPRFR